MKFLISQAELANSIELASKAIQNRPSHPILGNILVKATEDDHIQLSGFDLSMSIEVKCPANVIDLGMGGVTLPAGMFNSVISLIQQEDLTIEIDENAKAIIKSSTGVFEIQGLDTEEYPELPVLDGNVTKRFELPVKALLSGIKTVALCCSKEESKQILCGINIRFYPGDKSLVFASTDGRQLMVVTNTLEDFEHEFELTIPLRTLTEVVRVAEKYEDDMVQMSVDSGMISFSVAGRKITSRLMDGTYPAYQTLIPSSFTSEVIVDTRSLIGVLERNLNYSKEGKNIVDCKIDVTNQKLSFTTEIASVGKSDESIPAQISGEPPALFSVNAMYLLKGLKSKGFVSSSEVIIKMNGALKPVIIQPLGKSSVSHMIMPVSRRQ